MKISFTTLSCPNWNWDMILDNASKLGYNGIELRGIEGEMFLPKAKPFLPENIEGTIQQVKAKGLEICCLGTSCSFHEMEKFESSITEGKATIELAKKLGTPFIRVFGNNIPDISRKQETVERIAKGLNELCGYCQGTNVYMLLETHGDFADLNNLMPVVDRVEGENFGILWDVGHTHKVFGENIEEFFEKTWKKIKHTHIKDEKKIDDNFKLCIVGAGDIPIEKIVNLLKGKNYNGYLSLEWEKKWVPELEEPEIAIPQYIEYIKKFIK